MHIHFEKAVNAKCDCNILSMSWMGKVPEELPEEEGWKLNRTSYYQEGWLATGNVRGILGVTHTTAQLKSSSNSLPGTNRTNYNLRGHRAQVTLVQWNEPYQKLASCDSSGIIFVWIKFEGRWSIELINDRSTPVTHFSWSHDGRMALICYQDGFVLVGSVAGQRYWSSMLNLDSTITSGNWTPDDQRVYFGTSNGQIIVMDVHGMMISQVQLAIEAPIIHLSWSCEKFKMEENDESDSMNQFHSKSFLVLAVGFKNGLINIMKNYDDLSPIHVFTGLQSLHMEWSNSGEFLAVAGTRQMDYTNEAGMRVREWQNAVQFYTQQGVKLLNVMISTTTSPITALTWGHNDKRLFVAAGKAIHVGWVSRRVASLQLLCRLAIYKSISTDTCVSHLPLPMPVRALITSLHTNTIISNFPNLKDLREFATHPPTGNQRIYCTMIRHDEVSVQNSGIIFTLYVEYLGGLVPILKGKRTSKIRPEFIIFDPQDLELQTNNRQGVVLSVKGNRQGHGQLNGTHQGQSARELGRNNSSNMFNWTDDSDSDVDLCASPRLQRRRYRNRMMRQQRARTEWSRNRPGSEFGDEAPLNHVTTYNDTGLPEANRIVEVTSNIWGTKFKIHGLAKYLPDNLGHITYKTSLLHLQPRQMTLVMTELRDDIFLTPCEALSLSCTEDEEEDFSVFLGVNDFGASDRYYTGSIPPGSSPSRCFLQSRNTPSTIARRNEDLQRTNFENEIIQLRDSIRQLSRAAAATTLSYSSVQVQTSISQCCSTTCPDCQSGLPVHGRSSSTSTSTEPTTSATLISGTPQHTSSLRMKGSLITRANVESIDENTVATSNTHSHSLSRTSSSIRSPTRRCWTSSVDTETTQDNPTVPVTAPMHVRRSVSASYLDNVDHQLLVPVDMVLGNEQSVNPKRLVLIKSKEKTKPTLRECGKSKSWDSYDKNWWKLTQNPGGNSSLSRCPNCKLPTTTKFTSTPTPKTVVNKNPEDVIQIIEADVPQPSPVHRVVEAETIAVASTPVQIHRRSSSLLTPLLRRRDLRNAKNAKKNSSSKSDSSSDMDSSRNYIPPASPTHTRSTSSPNTPASIRRSNFFTSASSPIRQLFANSPLLSRRKNQNKQIPSVQNNILESSDDESDFGNTIGRTLGFQTQHSLPRSSIPFSNNTFRDLETFQKNQLRVKLKNKKIHNTEKSPKYIRRREFIMTNKAPMWNETSQVYQLDFGGRVTQESAKNFQIEFRGKQVMQFGRIEGNAYTLDFQYPFSAIQAFAVALANVTQRLK